MSAKGINEEMLVAERFWQQRLGGQALAQTPQHKDCVFSIVVPVCNERFDRLSRQIDSLLAQDGVAPQDYEVLYVVNNAPADGSDELAAVSVVNQELITRLRALKLPNVFVIDSSSPGCEIPDCNVGRARNRGVAEASWRFHQAGKNGLLIQTDADSYFEDTGYLKRLKQRVAEEPDLIGIAGGLVFEFSPDTDRPEEIAAMQGKLSLFELQQRWQYLEYWLLQIVARGKWDLLLHFSGAHMISRSFETACVGGLPDLAAGEDPAFGATLIEYAQQHGKRVIDGRDEYQVVTALRESFRTASSFGPALRDLDPFSPPTGTDLGALISAITSKKEPEILPVPMTWETYRHFEATIAQLPNGAAMNRRLESMASRLAAPSAALMIKPMWLRLYDWIRSQTQDVRS